MRPILAFLTIILAAFLLAPTVASVHEKVTDLNVQRELPWEIWRWSPDPTPPGFPDCDRRDRHLYSEITHWPERIRKDENFTLRGFVGAEEENRRGVPTIEVDIWINETKTEPGIFLGKTTTDDQGSFALTTSLPFDLQASHYHLNAHAKTKRINCSTYFEHWSDPEFDVISATTIEWLPVERAVVGRNLTVSGLLLDDVGGPVRNATVTVEWDGRDEQVTTKDDGSFSISYVPEEPGNETFAGEYRGSEFYDGHRNKTTVRIMEEAVELDGGVTTLQLARSSATTVAGQIFLHPDRMGDEVELRFEGLRVSACDDCDASSTLRAPLDEEGRFNATFVAPPSEDPGHYRVVVSGGGLREGHPYDVTLVMPTNITLDTEGLGLFSRDYEATVTLTDEVGRPLLAPVAFEGPDGWRENGTDANGTLAIAGSAACGSHDSRAIYNGTDLIQPSSATQPVGVCGFLAYVPAWLLATPWWVWPLVGLAGLVAWQVWRGYRQRYAPVILGGPALSLRFTQPEDEALGHASIGETILATAFLEEALPDGHRLRMGVGHRSDEQPLDGELRAHLPVVPERTGDLSVRAEIVDGKGHVVSRRTLGLRVVVYAEEIEKRYLRLRRETGAAESVTPREFEAWLHERAPTMPQDVARRLVRIFEEADYSPRAAGRADFAAYLAAERGVEEVSPDALA